MKFNPIQTDFSGGEISDRAIGHVDSNTYKSALARAYNMLPMASGSMASRGGAEWVGDFSLTPDLTIGTQSTPGETRVITLRGPGGTQNRYQLAVKQAVNQVSGGRAITGFDIFDEFGRVSLYTPFGTNWENWSVGIAGGGGNGLAWIDSERQRLYLTNPLASASLLTASLAVTLGPLPAGSSSARTIKFTVYGDSVTLTILNSSGGTIFATTTFAAGDHVVTLSSATISSSDNITFGCQGSVVAASIIDGFKFYVDPMGTSTDSFSNAGTLGAIGTTNLDSVKTGYVYFFDTPNNTAYHYNILVIPGVPPFAVLCVVPPTPTRASPCWSVHPLQFKSGTPAWAANISSVMAFQERLWFGVSDDRGSIHATIVGYGSVVSGAVVFDFVTASTPPLAAECLDLKLQSPSGKIVWMAALRGLVLGTTEKEMLFSLDQALAIDPTNGQTFDVTDHSAYGSDLALQAITMKDKVVWVQSGRQKVLSAGIRIETDTGLLAEDLGAVADHLLDLRIRSMCYLKTKTPRLVFCLDDGTLAIATMSGKTGIGWSRIQLGGGDNMMRVFSVATAETPNGSQLWLGTENSVILRIPNIESLTANKYQAAIAPGTPGSLAQPVPYLPSPRVQYAYWDTPAIMDCYRRRPVEVNPSVGGAPGFFQVTGLPYPIYPAPYVGQTYTMMLNGVPVDLGPASTIGFGIDNAKGWKYLWVGPGNLTLAPALNVGVTWTDKNNTRQASEAIVGLAYPNHKIRMLPQEGGSPSGTALGYKKRRLKIGIKLVDSYVPLVNGARPDPITPPTMFFDGVPVRVNPMGQDAESKNLSVYDFEITESDQLVISQDLPLRVEVAAVFSATTLNSGAGE